MSIGTRKDPVMSYNFTVTLIDSTTALSTILAPSRINLFVPRQPGAWMLPGTANTSRFCSRAHLAVMRVPLYSAASTTSTPIDIPLMILFRIGKFCGAANVPIGNSETRAPPD